MILLSLAAMVLYSAVSFNAVLLVKPIVGALKAPAGVQQPLAPQAGQEGEPARPLAEAQDKAEGWLANLAPVRVARDWLWPQGQASLKRVTALLAFLIGPLFLLSGFLQDYARGRVVWSVLADLRMAVFNRLSGLSLGFFSTQRTGDLLSRLTNDISQTQTALKIIFGKIILQPLMLAFFIAGALWQSWQLTVVAGAVFPLVLFVMGRYGARLRRYARRTLERLADLTDAITQMLNGIRVVKSFNMEEAEREAFRARTQAQLRRAFKLVRSRAWASVLPEFLVGVVATCAVLLATDYLHQRQGLALEETLPCIAFLALIGGRVRRLVKAYNDLQHSTAGVDRIFELIDMQPEIIDGPEAVVIEQVKEGVRFEDVWFAYDQTPVLQGITLFVPQGRTYAIVGETGAGKSTMLDLIPRFYDSTRGTVAIDGLDVRQVTHQSLMRQIAIVGQHPFLFNRSIAENIRYGKPEATDEEVHHAARAANIHDFILSLPEGYATMAGEAGGRLSGGQRQCITIARAILKNAPILILDEATSSLDAESEMLVQTALDNLMADRTTLVIAHRLSTVRHAHRIVVLRDGRIVEQGTHEELLQARGEYYRLYQLQFAQAPPESSQLSDLGREARTGPR
jgi:subfamily B ATP-binding cassette protein MsbA